MVGSVDLLILVDSAHPSLLRSYKENVYYVASTLEWFLVIIRCFLQGFRVYFSLGYGG